MSGSRGSSSWNTPKRLRAFLVSIWICSFLLFVASEIALLRARATVKTIGRETAPTIIAAEELSQQFADIDAHAANLLLGNSLQSYAAFQTFEERRVRLTARLVDAAQSITFSDELKRPMTALFENMGRYLELVAVSVYRHQHLDPRGAIESYEAATLLMHKTILPYADELAEANRSYMDRAYEDHESGRRFSEIELSSIGVALSGVLFFANIFLAIKARRIINPMIVFSTGLTLLFLALLFSTFDETRTRLKVAKEDAFESIHLLWRARALAYDGNGDQSRFLLNPDKGEEYDVEFQSKIKKLTSIPVVPERIKADLKLGRRSRLQFTGLFADEFRKENILLEEWNAMIAVLYSFEAYSKIDSNIRLLERESRHIEAVEMRVGTLPNQSNAVFASFDSALQDVIDINRRQFDKILGEVDRSLSRVEYMGPVFAFAIALLSYMGIRPRIREYEGAYELENEAV